MDQKAEERTFLEEGGIIVTNARFIVPAQTFAMSGITSVKSFEEKPKRLIPIVIIVIGLLSLFGKNTMPFAIAMLVIGGLWAFLQKSMFHVLLSTASGEAKALSSKNKEWISKVVRALNESIIHRG